MNGDPQSTRYHVAQYTFKGTAHLERPFVDFDLARRKGYAAQTNSVTGLLCLEDTYSLVRYLYGCGDLEKNNSIFVFSDPQKEPGKNIVNTIVPAGFIVELPGHRQEPTFLQREILMEQSLEAAIITKQNIVIPVNHLDNLAFFTFLNSKDGLLELTNAYDLIGVENDMAKISGPKREYPKKSKRKSRDGDPESKSEKFFRPPKLRTQNLNEITQPPIPAKRF